MAKKFGFKPAGEAKVGTEDRLQSLPDIDEKIRVANRSGGRRADFPGEATARVNAFIPEDLAWKLKEIAHQRKKTISQLVADWVRTL